MSNQGHTMTLHTYKLETIMSLQSVNFLHFMVSEIEFSQNFKGQSHYSKVKGLIKVTSWYCTPTTQNQCPQQVWTCCTSWLLRYRANKILFPPACISVCQTSLSLMPWVKQLALQCRVKVMQHNHCPKKGRSYIKSPMGHRYKQHQF